MCVCVRFVPLKAFTLDWNQIQRYWKCECVCVCCFCSSIQLTKLVSEHFFLSLASPTPPSSPPPPEIIFTLEEYGLSQCKTTWKQSQIHFSTDWFQKFLLSSLGKSRSFHCRPPVVCSSTCLCSHNPLHFLSHFPNTILYFIHSSPPPPPHSFTNRRYFHFIYKYIWIYFISTRLDFSTCVMFLLHFRFLFQNTYFSSFFRESCMCCRCHCKRDIISLIFHTNERLSMYYLFVYLAVGVFIKISAKCIQTHTHTTHYTLIWNIV